jgi:hypothetical protein
VRRQQFSEQLLLKCVEQLEFLRYFYLPLGRIRLSLVYKPVDKFGRRTNN